MEARITVLTGIFPPDIGGPATSVPYLASYLAQAGRAVTVVTLADRPAPATDDPCGVVRITRSASPLRRLWAVRRAVLDTRPDIILANGLHIESALVRRAPVVQKIVGDWAWEKARNRGWTSVGIDAFEQARLPASARSLRLLRRFVTRSAQVVIVPSLYVRELVRSWGVDGDRVQVVPNAAPSAAGSSRDGVSRRALFVGRLVSWKHVDHAIRVLAMAPSFELDVVGTGPELDGLRDLSRSLGAENRVQFHGSQPRDVVLEMMNRASFLVLPSSYEGMPHVVLEAFAAGLPVVAADAAGTPELVHDRVSGLLYPWGRLDALADAVHAVMDPQLAGRLVDGGRAVASRLTVEASALATCDVLDEALRCA